MIYSGEECEVCASGGGGGGGACRKWDRPCESREFIICSRAGTSDKRIPKTVVLGYARWRTPVAARYISVVAT